MKKVSLLFAALVLVQFAIFANTTNSSEISESAMVATDECADATDIGSLLGGAIDTPVSSTMFTNVGATVSAFEATLTGFECFGEPDGGGATPSLENTQWVTFIGDGGLYSIVSTDCNATVTDYIDNGDTQFVIFSGVDCDDLTPVACNEDLPGGNAAGPYPAGLDFQTEAGQVYYMLIDGFAGSDGEYCLEFTQRAGITCEDIALGVPTITTTDICFNDVVDIQLSGTVIPNSPLSGFVWGLYAADVTGSMDPFSDPNAIGFFAASAAVYLPALVNDGTQLPAGTYFFTPIVYGSAMDTIGDSSLGALSFAAGCVITGVSIPVTFLTELTPLVGTSEIVNETDTGSNGEASVTVTGGSDAYNYLWSNGETTSAITNLAGGTYMVTVSDQTACTDDIVISVTIDNSVAINELDFAQAIELFPNPASQMTAIQYGFSESVDLDITITNTIGQVVMQRAVSNTINGSIEINLSDYATGIYTVQLSEGQNSTSRRLVVTK